MQDRDAVQANLPFCSFAPAEKYSVLRVRTGRQRVDPAPPRGLDPVKHRGQRRPPQSQVPVSLCSIHQEV